MQLNKEQRELFESILDVASAAGIDKLIIEPGKVRGIDEKKTVVMISELKDNLCDQVINLNRLSQLNARLNLNSSFDDFNLAFDVSTKNQEEISQINYSSGRTKGTFKCASSDFIRGVPKSVNDQWRYHFTLSPATIDMIGKAISTMGSDIITFTSKDKKTVDIEIADVNRDAFVMNVSDNLSSEDPSIFSFNYSIRTLQSLLKKCCSDDGVDVVVGSKGIMRLTMKGHNILIIPNP